MFRSVCRAWAYASLVAALGASACTSAPTTGGMQPTDGYVYGIVRDLVGATQPGAQVEVEFFPFPCSAPPSSPTKVLTTTLSDGSYRRLVRGPHFGEWVACVIVRAEASTGQMGTAAGVSLVLRDELHGRPDSIRVDVLLQ